MFVSFLFCLFCLVSALLVLLWTGFSVLQALWVSDAQWFMLLFVEAAAAVCVILAGWQSTRGGMRSALRGFIFAIVYAVLILAFRYGLRSYLDDGGLLLTNYATAFYVLLHTGIGMLVQRNKSKISEAK